MPPTVYPPGTTASSLATKFSPSIRNRTILITGASPNGLGAHFASFIAPHAPARLILTGRSPSKLQPLLDTLAPLCPSTQLIPLTLDLSSQTSIRAAATHLLDTLQGSIDVLVLNAGIMAPPYSTTKEGIESQFGTNHIGHFLFTNLLLPKLLTSEHTPRVVSVSSDGYRFSPIRFLDPNFRQGETYDKWLAYGQSKTANMLFALSLARRLGANTARAPRGFVAVSLHPGVVGTNLASNSGVGGEDFKDIMALDKAMGNAQSFDPNWPTYNSTEEGAAAHVRAAFDDEMMGCNGGFLRMANVDPLQGVKAWGRDEVEAERLWRLSEELVGEKFDV